MNRSLMLLIVISTALTLVIGCSPATTENLSGSGTAGTVIGQDATEDWAKSINDFLSATDLEAAAVQMDAMAQEASDAASDVEELLNAGLESLFNAVDTPEEYAMLVNNSIALNGYMSTPIHSSNTSFSAAKASSCGDGSPTIVYFINGINNSVQEWRSSVAALAKIVFEDPPKDLIVGGYYNVSAKDKERAIFGGYIKPFFCSLVQTAGFIRYGETWRKYCEIAGYYAAVGIDLAQAGEQAINEWCSLLPDPTDVEEFAKVIKLDIDDGYTVIIVAHSQGNFMTQQALERLKDPDGQYDPPADSVGVISVGSPTTSKFACLSYNQVPVMIDNEAMDMLPGTAEHTCADQTGSQGNGPEALVARHSFNESYLRNTCARSQIKQAVHRMACELTNVRKKNTDGGAACGYTSSGVTVTHYTNANGTTSQTSDGQLPDPYEADIFVCGYPQTFTISTSLSNVESVSIIETVPVIDPYMPGLLHTAYRAVADEGKYIQMPLTIGQCPSGTTCSSDTLWVASNKFSIIIYARDDNNNEIHASLGVVKP